MKRRWYKNRERSFCRKKQGNGGWPMAEEKKFMDCSDLICLPSSSSSFFIGIFGRWIQFSSCNKLHVSASLWFCSSFWCNDPPSDSYDGSFQIDGEDPPSFSNVSVRASRCFRRCRGGASIIGTVKICNKQNSFQTKNSSGRR